MYTTGKQVENIVVAANERGFQLQGEEKWSNWSKYAVEPRTLPAPGDRIRVTFDTQGFVRGVQILSQGNPSAGGPGTPSTTQPVSPSTNSNGDTGQNIGASIASQYSMHADRDFRLACLKVALETQQWLNSGLENIDVAMELAAKIQDWSEGKES